MGNCTGLDRRRLLGGLGSAALAAAAASRAGVAGAQAPSAGAPGAAARPLTRAIPSSGETVPLVGLGTWITFNVGNDAAARARCTAVMEAFFDAGGTMIDSSPMYASSQDVVGEGLARLGALGRVFSAEKVWISQASRGEEQIERSRAKWGVRRFDLMQVHNLLSWQEHLPRLHEMKSAGSLRYVGITTSEGRRHAEFERVMAGERLDFVQVSYNILDREVEARILPLAAERGIGVIVNRPFREGRLTRALEGQPLPEWAGEIGAGSWAQFILKFILSHPAVTCAIPATTSISHARENMAAASEPLPDPAMRRRMVAWVEAL